MKYANVLSVGAYLPKRRLQREVIVNNHIWFAPGLQGLRKGHRATANWDEDSITMAVEAARDCLSGVERKDIDSLSLASTTLPFVDRLNSGIVKEALNLQDSTGATDVTGSQRCGASSLLDALNGNQTRLCLAAELPLTLPGSESELTAGDGAAAILVGKEPGIAKCLGTYSKTVDFVDHFRAKSTDFDYAWESRWIRDEGYQGILGSALDESLELFGLDAASFDHVIIPITARGVANKLAERSGFRSEAVRNTLAAEVGYTGPCHSLLMLAHVLESARAGDKIIVSSFGQGADIMAFEVTGSKKNAHVGVEGNLGRGKETDNYMRYLFHRGLLKLDRGMRAEQEQKQPSSTLYRNRKTVLSLVGGRCTESGVVQFPKGGISVDQATQLQNTQEDYPLAEKRARILTHTSDVLTYTPDPPAYYGMIDFEGGGRMPVEFIDADDNDIQVGNEVRMVFRIKAIDEPRNYTKYFWKATPVTEGGS